MLADLASALGDLAAYREDHPMETMRWTRAQRRYLQVADSAQITLFRAGNQVGKTTVGAYLAIEACLRGGAGFEAWVVCTTWSQAVAIMTKVHDLAPKSQVVPTTFTVRAGYGKDNPALIFRNGAVLRFRTTGQGAQALAGATIQYIWIDEPTTEGIFRELRGRVRRTGGKLRITLTPVNSPCGWLRDMVERGAIPEVHARLDDDALTFESGERMVRGDGQVLDAAWVESEINQTPTAWVPVVIHGEWDAATYGAFFSLFDAKTMVRDVELVARTGQSAPWYSLGIDYAAADREVGSVALLISIMHERRADGRQVWWCSVEDEVILNGRDDEQRFAEAIVTMLGRQPMTWGGIKEAYGDNQVVSRYGKKNNYRTHAAIAEELGLRAESLSPQIREAKRGNGTDRTITPGLTFLWRMMAEGRFFVSPRCVKTIKALQTWVYTQGVADHEMTDIIDALRYALKSVIFATGTPRGRG